MPSSLTRWTATRLSRRVVALCLMLALLIFFRHLALLLVSFVICSRGLGWLGGRLARALGKSDRVGVLLVLLGLGALLGLGIWGSVHMGSLFFTRLRELQQGRPLQELLVELQSDLMHRVPAWVPLDGLREKAPAMLTPAVTYLRATGRILLETLIGLIIAIIYLLDRAPVDTLVQGPPAESVLGSLRRYFGYVAEAIVITISLQVLVALVNTALTLPVLFFMRLPHVLAFTSVIFFSSLVPIVGNLVSGAVLIIASYVYKGVLAVVLFVVTTFVLHKIEAYYLNPRLATRHVNLPALVLVISLILFEHMFGLIGLFLSFPALYVGLNVLNDLKRAAAHPESASPGTPTATVTPVAVTAPAPPAPPPVAMPAPDPEPVALPVVATPEPMPALPLPPVVKGRLPARAIKRKH